MLLFVFRADSISLKKGESTRGALDLGCADDGGEADCSGRDCVSVFVFASTSSVPDCAGLTGGCDSDEQAVETVSADAVGLDSSMRLYSTGVYLSKLACSLLGGRLLGVNVLV